MTTGELERLSRRLEPVRAQIAAYDSRRPLNGAARKLAGKEGALQILWAEARELAELRVEYDGVPPDQLNGGRRKVAAELGDTVFGLDQYFQLRGNGELGRAELLMLGGVATWMLDTEKRYGLDLVECGKWVNVGKNAANNPDVFYQNHHPLDPDKVVIEKNDLVRRGLRRIRNMDTQGVLTTDNLNHAIQFWGYTGEVLRDSGLAFEFITKVARDGVRL